MKKNYFYLLILILISTMPFTACSNNDEPTTETEQEEVEHNPEADDDQKPVLAYDGLAFLQSALAIVSENNELIRRVNGKPLDPSNPTVISIPVTDLDMAEKTFLGWVAPEKKAEKVDDGYIYNLTDAEGKLQGSVTFSAESGEPGVLAEMTLAPGTELHHVSEVKFIDSELWPENDDVALYQARKIYQLEGEVYKWYEEGDKMRVKIEKKMLDFYCLRGNDTGLQAILVWLCPDTNNKFDHPRPQYYILEAKAEGEEIKTQIYKRLPSIYEAEVVLNFFYYNYQPWLDALKDMDDKGLKWSDQWGTGTTGNLEFMINYYEYPYLKCLDLDSKDNADIDWVHGLSWYKYRYMHVRIFPPYIYPED